MSKKAVLSLFRFLSYITLVHTEKENIHEINWLKSLSSQSEFNPSEMLFNSKSSRKLSYSLVLSFIRSTNTTKHLLCGKHCSWCWEALFKYDRCSPWPHQAYSPMDHKKQGKVRAANREEKATFLQMLCCHKASFTTGTLMSDKAGFETCLSIYY